MIEIKNIVKRYGQRDILSIDSLNIGDEGVIGLVGNNGAGKTTLLKLIAGLIRPTEGHCLVNGKEAFRDMQCGNIVAIIDEKISYCGKTKLIDIYKEYEYVVNGFDYNKALNYMNMFNLKSDYKYGILSKGMTNIANMILGFCLPQKIILFDEITSGLDEYSRIKFKQVLCQEIIDNPKLYIVSTHLFGEIASILQDVILIKNGKVEMKDSIDNVASYFITIRGLRTVVAPLLQERLVYSDNKIGEYCEVVIKNDITRRMRMYIQDNNIDYCCTPVNEACALIANVEAKLWRVK